MSSISSFDIISVVVPDSKILLCTPASAANAAAVNPNGTKTLLAYGWITLFINGNPVFNNGRSSLPRNPRDCIILDNWVFANVISVDELLGNVLQRLSICLLINNNSCGKLVLSSQLPIIFDDNLKTTSVLFFYCRLQLIMLWIWQIFL